MALSADGRLVASGGEEGTVRLWETDTGRPLATLQGHTGRSGAWRCPPTVGWWPAAASMARCGCGRPPPAAALATLQGQTGTLSVLALSADGAAGRQRRCGWRGATVGGRDRTARGHPARAHRRGA